eukprot:tig00020904_g15180.t1
MCANQGVYFVPVDLRDGVNPEEYRDHENVLRSLREVDASGPYFVCLLGDEYGWCQGANGNRDQVLLQQFERAEARYPFLRGYRDRSVTEIELLHALLSRPSADYRGRVFVYIKGRLRESEGAAGRADHAAARLRELKRAAGEAGAVVRPFYEPGELYALVRADVGNALSGDLRAAVGEPLLSPARGPHLTRLSQEKAALDFHVAQRAAYAPLRPAADELRGYASGPAGAEGRAALLSGPHGSGKTALLSNWIADHREENPRDFVFASFAGQGGYESTLAAALHRAAVEIAAALGFRVQASDLIRLNSNSIRPSLNFGQAPRALAPAGPGAQGGEAAEFPPRPMSAGPGSGGHAGPLLTVRDCGEVFLAAVVKASIRMQAAARGGTESALPPRLVVVFDALDQYEDSPAAQELAAWVPDKVPPGLRLVISATGEWLEAASALGSLPCPAREIAAPAPPRDGGAGGAAAGRPAAPRLGLRGPVPAARQRRPASASASGAASHRIAPPLSARPAVLAPAPAPPRPRPGASSAAAAAAAPGEGSDADRGLPGYVRLLACVPGLLRPKERPEEAAGAAARECATWPALFAWLEGRWAARHGAATLARALALLLLSPGGLYESEGRAFLGLSASRYCALLDDLRPVLARAAALHDPPAPASAHLLPERVAALHSAADRVAKAHFDVLVAIGGRRMVLARERSERIAEIRRLGAHSDPTELYVRVLGAVEQLTAATAAYVGVLERDPALAGAGRTLRRRVVKVEGAEGEGAAEAAPEEGGEEGEGEEGGSPEDEGDREGGEEEGREGVAGEGEEAAFDGEAGAGPAAGGSQAGGYEESVYSIVSEDHAAGWKFHAGALRVAAATGGMSYLVGHALPYPGPVPTGPGAEGVPRLRAFEALRTGRPVAVPDVLSDPGTVFFRQRAAGALAAAAGAGPDGYAHAVVVADTVPGGPPFGKDEVAFLAALAAALGEAEGERRRAEAAAAARADAIQRARSGRVTPAQEEEARRAADEGRLRSLVDARAAAFRSRAALSAQGRLDALRLELSGIDAPAALAQLAAPDTAPYGAAQALRAVLAILNPQDVPEDGEGEEADWNSLRSPETLNADLVRRAARWNWTADKGPGPAALAAARRALRGVSAEAAIERAARQPLSALLLEWAQAALEHGSERLRRSDLISAIHARAGVAAGERLEDLRGLLLGMDARAVLAALRSEHDPPYGAPEALRACFALHDLNGEYDPADLADWRTLSKPEVTNEAIFERVRSFENPPARLPHSELRDFARAALHEAEAEGAVEQTPGHPVVALLLEWASTVLHLLEAPPPGAVTPRRTSNSQAGHAPPTSPRPPA